MTNKNKKNDQPQSVESTVDEKNLDSNSDVSSETSEEIFKDISDENKELKIEVSQLKNDILRLNAEIDNMRKRYEKQISETIKFSVTNFAKDLLVVLDNIDIALSYIPEKVDQKVQTFISGIQMTKKEFESVLSKHGVSSVSANIGDIFDHNIHHVTSKVESEQYKSNTIINVLQSGYKLNDRLLRPASVIVAKSE